MLLSAALLALAATANAATGFCTPTQATCMIQSDPIVTTFVGLGAYYEMTAPGTYYAFQSTEMTVQVVIGSHFAPNLGRNVLVTDQLTYTCGKEAPVTYTTANVPSRIQLTCNACPAGVNCIVTIGQAVDPVPNLHIQQILYNRGTNGLGGLCYKGDAACPNSPIVGGGAATKPDANVPQLPCATAGGCCTGNQCGNSGATKPDANAPKLPCGTSGNCCTGNQCGNSKPAGTVPPAGNTPGGIYAPVTTAALVKPTTPPPAVNTPSVSVPPAVKTPSASVSVVISATTPALYVAPPAVNTATVYVPPAGNTPGVTPVTLGTPTATPAKTPAPSAYHPTTAGNILQNDALRTVSLNVAAISMLAIFL
ncbi:hypothetical protein HDU98_010941 [Podochytrium sp. JEL0797]|nr:hypothetical protein HDU98_010941 [Podochytrium sp. JEL0797]